MRTQYQDLTSFAQEIERREQNKQDYIASSSKLAMVDDSSLSVDGVGTFHINNFAHGQIAEKLKIPKVYYDRIGDVKGLRDANVNMLMWNEPHKKRLVRTLDGNVRAMLSDSYKPIDNYDIIKSCIFPLLNNIGAIEIHSSSLSETQMYLQIAFKQFQVEIRQGQIIAYSGTFTNSEVGKGSVDLLSWIKDYSCNNGAIRTSIFRKYHIGKRTEEGEDVSIWKNDTLQAELESYRLRMRDAIMATFTEENFLAEVNKIKNAISDKIPNIVDTVENVTKRYNFSEDQGKAIISDMTNTGHINRWGLISGITALAHKIDNPDVQFEIEKIGGSIIDISPADWRYLNVA